MAGLGGESRRYGKTSPRRSRACWNGRYESIGRFSVGFPGQEVVLFRVRPMFHVEPDP